MKSFLNSSSVDLEALQLVRAQKIAEKREQLRKNWEKQGYSYGLENIGNDEFVEKYIRQGRPCLFPVRWCFVSGSSPAARFRKRLFAVLMRSDRQAVRSTAQAVKTPYRAK